MLLSGFFILSFTGCCFSIRDKTNGHIILWESFENGFPPENWTNTGWYDSLYGEPFHGNHWAYSWSAADTLTSYPLEFGYNTTLTFWYRCESAYPHCQETQVLIDRKSTRLNSSHYS